MKQTLFFLGTFLAMNSSAQSYQIDNGGNISNTTLTYWVDTGSTFTTYYDIKNVSMTGVSGQVKKVNIQLNDPGATTWFCVGTQCYLPIATTSLSFVVAPQSQVLLTCDFNPNHAFGTTIVRYTVVNDNDPNDTVNITIYYNSAGPAGIPVYASPENMDVYPNPADGSINIRFNSALAGERSIAIFSVDGALMKEFMTAGDKVSLATDDMANGIYFCRIMQDGLVVGIEKIVIAH